MIDYTYLVDVLETPLGPSLEWDDADPIQVERVKIAERYCDLRHLGFGVASRQARAEWLEAWLKREGR